MPTRPASIAPDRRRSAQPKRGFSAVEVVVSLAVLGLGSAFAYPALDRYLDHGRSGHIARQTEGLLERARHEAIHRQRLAVVTIDPDRREVVAFVDVHGATPDDPPDGIFNPRPEAPTGETDTEIGRHRLPEGFDFRFLGDRGLDSIDGFDHDGRRHLPDGAVVFEPLGTVLSAGALRIADPRDHYVEIRVLSTAARITVRRWDGTAWREIGDRS